MHAHLTRWQRFQVKAMGPALTGGFLLASAITGYLVALITIDRRSRR